MNAEEPTPRHDDVTDEGPLWEGVVPGVLRGLYVGRRTGTLTFVHEEERRGVHLRRGNIVNADTNVREDRLGAVLVRAGRLTEADRRRAEGFAVRDRKRFGSVLVELGVLDRETLEEALALHVDVVLSKVFSWTDGRYEFRPQDELPLDAGEVTLRVSTGDLILKAARSVQDPDVVRYNLGDLGRVLLASSDPLLRFQQIRLGPLDGYVMSRVDGVMSAREILQLIPLPRPEVERSLFGLLSTGVVEFRGAVVKAAARADAGSRPAAAAEELTPAAGPTEGAAVDTGAPGAPETPSLPLEPSLFVDGSAFEPPRGEPTIVLDMPRFEEQPPVDPTIILDMARFQERPPADPTVVLAAPRAEAPVDPTVIGGTVDPTVVGAPLPPLHPAELRRLEVLEMHRGLKTKSHFELLGVPRDATEAQVREAYFRLAKRFHPDGQHQADLGELRDALESIFRRLGEAYEILRNPRIRVVYERNLSMAPVVGRDDTGPAPTVAGPSDDPEAMLARAHESFASERYWEVIQILEKAVPRAQGAVKQRQRVLLARAYARTPDWVKQGEELLVSVVQQDPSDADAHFHLGVIYRGQGLRSRALTSFRRVLELAPGHAEARRHVAEIDREAPTS
jgi:hypothetical protein